MSRWVFPGEEHEPGQKYTVPLRSGSIRIIAVAVGVALLAGVALVLVRALGTPGLGVVFVQESVTEGGYTGRYVLRNHGSEPAEGWTLEFDLPQGTTVVEHWDAELTPQGQGFAFAGLGRKAVIEPGGVVSFGFMALGTGRPANCRANGHECLPAQDTAPPTTPANLRVTGVTVSSISLAWDVAQDDVAVVAYRIQEPGGATRAVVGSSPTTEATITGLTPSTSYTFQALAVDAAGNQSRPGEPVTIRTAEGSDEVGSPSPGANLRLVAATESTAQLAWEMGDEADSVEEFRVYDGADVVATTTSLSTVVTDLKPGTRYEFTVSAVDPADNESWQRSEAIVVTTAAARQEQEEPEADEPSSPPPPVRSPSPSRSPSSAPRRVQESSTFTGTSAGTLLSRGKPATASSEGQTAEGEPIFGPEQAVDGDPETRWASLRRIDPSWLRVDLGSVARISRVRLEWDLSCAEVYSIEVSKDKTLWTPIYFTHEGEGGVEDVELGGVGRYVQMVGSKRCRPDWGYSLRGFDVYGTFDEKAGAGTTDETTDKDGTTDKTADEKADDSADQATGDAAQRRGQQAPAAPRDLKATDVTADGLALSWAAGSDDVAGYDIYHDRKLLRTVEAPAKAAKLAGLAPNTAYRLTVRARNRAGEESPPSVMVPVTTLAADPAGSSDLVLGHEIEAPSALRHTGVTPNGVTLVWDEVGPAGSVSYDVYAGGAKIGTVDGTCVMIVGLANDTPYQFQIKARDAAGNNSPASKTIDVRTGWYQDGQPAPSPAGTAPSAGQQQSPAVSPSQAPSQAPSPQRSSQPAPSSAPSGGTRIGQVGTLTTDLKIPWGVAFLPDGNALVSERDTFDVYRVAPNGGKTRVGRVPGVSGTGGEGGLLGLAVSPTFSSDRLVYAYHSTGSDNRVVRMRYDGSSLGQPQAVLTGIPMSKYHNGGRIIFGPDGMLYIATGDAQSSDRAQDRGSLGGKILRVTPDGKPASGNPFGTAVYSYGHRNVQGLWFDSQKRLWASEFGDADRDEINLIKAGSNYGWPVCEGKCGRSGMVDPAYDWPVAQASPSGIAIVGDTIFMASLRGTRLWRMEISGDGVRNVEAYFVGTYGRLRTVVPAPDGSLWLTTSNHDANGQPRSGDDRILRIAMQR